jgi:hypothetical protein
MSQLARCPVRISGALQRPPWARLPVLCTQKSIAHRLGGRKRGNIFAAPMGPTSCPLHTEVYCPSPRRTRKGQYARPSGRRLRERVVVVPAVGRCSSRIGDGGLFLGKKGRLRANTNAASGCGMADVPAARVRSFRFREEHPMKRHAWIVSLAAVVLAATVLPSVARGEDDKAVQYLPARGLPPRG